MAMLSSREPSPDQSPLSMLSSDDDPFEDDHDQLVLDAMPPAKRQKIGESSMRATPTAHIPEDDALTDISSDTDGEIPIVPSSMRPDDDDTHEQVTVCTWLGCDAGDLGNMDRLVEHIHVDHIDSRPKKYSCEWSDCPRRGHIHASGYALKAHMRSHTRAKPFFCTLPECDRSFTRSDALAKHMRTVHEIEALRPSDPVPKSMTQLPSGKSVSKLKLIMKAPQYKEETPTALPPPAAINGATNEREPPARLATTYPPELGIMIEEEAMGPKELWRLLRRQVHWAEQTSEELKKEAALLEDIRRREYIDKEILLEHVIKEDMDYTTRRRAVLAGKADIPSAALKAAADNELKKTFSPMPGNGALSTGPAPARPPSGEDERAAAVLASLHQI